MNVEKELTIDSGSFSMSEEGSVRKLRDSDIDDDGLSSTAQDYDGASEEEIEIAADETRWIKWSKFLVGFVLILGTTLTAYGAYNFTASKEEDDFTSQFESIGNVIIDVSQITAENVFDTINSMSTTITSYASDTNATWPFVTIPDFGARASQLLKLSGSFYLAFTPIVQPNVRTEWEKYSIENQGWLQEEQEASEYGAPPGNHGRQLQQGGRPNSETTDTVGILPYIWNRAGSVGPQTGGRPLPVEDRDTPYGPFWQFAPPSPYQVNMDVFSVSNFPAIYEAMIRKDRTILSHQFHHDGLPIEDERGWPISYITSPIHETLEPGSDIVSIFNAVLPWHKYFINTVPAGLGGLHVVVRNTCGQQFTYVADGDKVTFVGFDDYHDRRFSHMEIHDRFDVLAGDDEEEERSNNDSSSNSTDFSGICLYSLSVYPTEEFHSTFVTNEPYYYTAAVVFIFVLTSMVFILYDCLVRKKDEKVMTSATNTNAIINQLFPETVRERLIDDAARRREEIASGPKKTGGVEGGHHLQAEDQKALLLKTKPIADLFPNVTVLFADIAGFTAWASSREPSQVFTLLEQIYGSFDILAKARGVFKVETTGDCYVAAAGLPEPRVDHAVVMMKFARDCLNEMNQNVHHLEVLLGPDTAELCMRFGLHSGPVTGGVLRGDKSRFQLFGDTVNMASRIESSGMRNRIHISQETANCLIEQGKSSWIKPRKDLVFCKGKGEVQTYWMDIGRAPSIRSVGSHIKARDHLHSGMRLERRKHNMKAQRLIDWNVTVLEGLLKKIVAMRPAAEPKKKNKSKSMKEPHLCTEEGLTVLDEVKEIIELPGKAAAYKQDPDSIELDPEVIAELREYVTAISNMYLDNPFHSFEHASHVVQSVTKLLSRVVTPDAIDYNDLSYKKKQKTSQLHEYTYGITSDPLTQFSVAFSALIHDVEHSGIPNANLIKEDLALADKYNNKSVAEQNSVDIAWGLLEGDNFSRLRRTIYSTEAELRRFRQLVVNSVMATDIADKELGALRKNRWNKAFNIDQESNHSGRDANPDDDVNRKATIVIEHLIQASDVSHTMQHWHVYLKWNGRLFREMYKAFLAGRIENDPSKGWYKGEIGFFDFYLIPLGKKLKECGVFGVSSDEYLNYAVANRKEWELKGKEIVAGYLASFHESSENGIMSE